MAFINCESDFDDPKLQFLNAFTTIYPFKTVSKGKEYLGILRKAEYQLRMLASDILDLGKIESATSLVLNKVPFNLKEEILFLKHLFDFDFEQKGITWAVFIQKDMPTYIWGDTTRLHQILHNLVKNALKFTHKGFVELRVSCVHNHLFEFAIKDTGIGIPKSKQATIFDNFHQIENDGIHNYGGTGLGLPISKQLAEQQGGTLMVKSEIDKGSVFILSLIYELASEEDYSHFSQFTGKSSLSLPADLRILMAEDNAYNQLLTKDSLLKYLPSLYMEIVNNGLDMLQNTENKDYDVILMDINMPQLDGISTSQALRKKGNKTPIIVLSATVTESEIERVLNIENTYFLSKPYIPKTLLDLMKKAYNNHYAEDRQDFHSTGSDIDLSFLDKFVEGDMDRRQEYIAAFLAYLPQQIEDIKQAQKSNKKELLCSRIHSLMPHLKQMGLGKSYRLGTEIENKLNTQQTPVDAETKFSIFYQTITEESDKLSKLS